MLSKKKGLYHKYGWKCVANDNSSTKSAATSDRFGRFRVIKAARSDVTLLNPILHKEQIFSVILNISQNLRRPLNLDAIIIWLNAQQTLWLIIENFRFSRKPMCKIGLNLKMELETLR